MSPRSLYSQPSRPSGSGARRGARVARRPSASRVWTVLAGPLVSHCRSPTISPAAPRRLVAQIGPRRSSRPSATLPSLPPGATGSRGARPAPAAARRPRRPALKGPLPRTSGSGPLTLSWARGTVGSEEDSGFIPCLGWDPSWGPGERVSYASDLEG